VQPEARAPLLPTTPDPTIAVKQKITFTLTSDRVIALRFIGNSQNK
jgi:hypothetical protein